MERTNLYLGHCTAEFLQQYFLHCPWISTIVLSSCSMKIETCWDGAARTVYTSLLKRWGSAPFFTFPFSSKESILLRHSPQIRPQSRAFPGAASLLLLSGVLLLFLIAGAFLDQEAIVCSSPKLSIELPRNQFLFLLLSVPGQLLLSKLKQQTRPKLIFSMQS